MWTRNGLKRDDKIMKMRPNWPSFAGQRDWFSRPSYSHRPCVMEYHSLCSSVSHVRSRSDEMCVLLQLRYQICSTLWMQKCWPWNVRMVSIRWHSGYSYGLSAKRTRVLVQCCYRQVFFTPLQINCRIAGCFPGKSRWCLIEHAFREVKCKVLWAILWIGYRVT